MPPARGTDSRWRSRQLGLTTKPIRRATTDSVGWRAREPKRSPRRLGHSVLSLGLNQIIKIPVERVRQSVGERYLRLPAKVIDQG